MFNLYRQSQTTEKDVENIGVIMHVHYTKYGTRVEQKHFDLGNNKPWSNSEIAREIIMNALYDVVKKHQGEYNNYFLQQVENDWGEGRAVAVRKKIVSYIWRIFDKYHTSKFDMSGHPIVTEVFHSLEKTGDMPKTYNK